MVAADDVLIRTRPWRAALLLALLLTSLAGCSRNEASPVPAPEVSPAVAAISPSTDLLTKEARQYVWDVEHLAFVVEQKVLPILKRALAGSDRETLAKFLAPQFAAQVPQAPWQDELRVGDVRSFRWQQSEDNTRDVDAAGFLDVALEYRRLFDPDPKACSVSIGLVRFGPVDRREFHGPWRGVWRVQLLGKRGSAPVDVLLRLAVDLDAIDEQIPQRQHWIRSATLERVERVESPAPLLREVTDRSGFDTKRLYENWAPGACFKPNTGGVYVCDYNRDGRLDVLVSDAAAGFLLYRGLGDGRFVDATDEAKLPRLQPGATPHWTVCCWADWDGDGDGDLIAQDRLFENLGDGTFRDITERTNLRLTPAAGYAVADFDLDGRVDLYVCHTGAYRYGQRERDVVPWIDGGLGIGNVLWRNQGDWQFEDVTEQTNTSGHGISCFAAVCFDANGDRRPDLLAVNEFGRNALLIQDGQQRCTESDVDPVFGGLSMGVIPTCTSRTCTRRPGIGSWPTWIRPATRGTCSGKSSRRRSAASCTVPAVTAPSRSCRRT
jgi:hypothetical protein